jgi:hypothetical protein
MLPGNAEVKVFENGKPASEIADLELELNPDGRIIMWIKIGE